MEEIIHTNAVDNSNATIEVGLKSEVDNLTADENELVSTITNILSVNNETKLFLLECFYELTTPHKLADTRNEKFQECVINFVKVNPDLDFIYRFALPEDQDSIGFQCLRALSDNTGKDLFIGGSSALYYLQRYHSESTINWKSNDIDLFYLNCIKNARKEGHIPGLDMIFCTDK